MLTTSALYASLGNSRTFTVERAFMRHTFHVAFVSHLGQKRKYCFSVPDAAARAKWGTTLNRQIWVAQVKKQQQANGVNLKTPEDCVRRAAEAVALQVLRDALIAAEDKNEEHVGGSATPHSHGHVSPSSKQTSSIPARVLRQGSVSVAYIKAHAEEADLGPLQPTRGHHSDGSGMVELQTGKELVLLCRQNSLLPAVLALLQKGAGTSAHVGQLQAAQTQTKSQNHKVAESTSSHGDSSQSHSSHSHNNSHSPPAHIPTRAVHLQEKQPKRSAGLRALMHDRRL